MGGVSRPGRLDIIRGRKTVIKKLSRVFGYFILVMVLMILLRISLKSLQKQTYRLLLDLQQVQKLLKH